MSSLEKVVLPGFSPEFPSGLQTRIWVRVTNADDRAVSQPLGQCVWEGAQEVSFSAFWRNPSRLGAHLHGALGRLEEV